MTNPQHSPAKLLIANAEQTVALGRQMHDDLAAIVQGQMCDQDPDSTIEAQCARTG